MKNIIFAMAVLALLAGCDAGSNKQGSSTQSERKVDDAKQF